VVSAGAEERTVIAGDMVASVGTIIVDPPEGDMRLYLESLERLRDLAPRLLLPAHGPPVGPGKGDADALLAFYLRHRREREERVVAALLGAGAARVEELVPRAYPDVAPAVHPLAARSLLAHLYKLRDEGRALERDGVWEPSASR
jgi:glyoxylase-like metal-dependent hydrolase (beta-lactamase superfamily II)